MPGYKALIWTRCLRAAKRGYLPSTCFAIFIGSTASTCFLLVDVATTSKQCAIKWGPRCCFDPTCWTHSCWWCTENSVTLSSKFQLSDFHAGEMAVCIQFPDPRLQLVRFFELGCLKMFQHTECTFKTPFVVQQGRWMADSPRANGSEQVTNYHSA